MKHYLPLSELCVINMGQSPDSSSYNTEKRGLPFFQGNADFGKISPHVRIWCDAPTKIAHAGDLLLSVRAPIGALNIADSDCCIGRGLAAMTCIDKKCDQRWLFFALQSKVAELQSKGTGSTFKAISKKILFDTLLPDYPIAEQREIARNLDSLTRMIFIRKKQMEKLTQLASSRFIEMFGDPIENPKGWTSKPFNDCCIKIGDGLHGTPEYDSAGHYPFINGNNFIQSQVQITETTKYVGASEFHRLHIPLSTNAILMSINGTLGNLAYYRGENIVLGKSACFCDLKPELNKMFVFALMGTDSFKRFLEESATKSTIKNVGLKAIRNFMLILPPLSLQTEFAAFIEQLDKSKFTIRQSLEKLNLAYKAQLQEYFG